MIDVFLRWYPTTELRRWMSMVVRERLSTIQGINLRIVTKHDVPDPYHIESKRYAERCSRTEIYCVMDDDQLPLRDSFFAIGENELAMHPEYGMLAGFPLEYGLQGLPYASNLEHVIEAHSIGCPYFVRKGTLKHFPDSPIRSYDGDLSKVVTDQGLKTGFVRYAVYNHLGYGFSQVERLQ